MPWTWRCRFLGSPAFDLNPNPEPGAKLLSTAIDGSSREIARSDGAAA